MKHEVKTYRAEVKARQEGDKGLVTAVVSIFNNVDLGGDRVLPGAFKRTIAEWQAKGDPVPVIWSHEWDQPESHIGFVDPQNMKETDLGLQVEMQFDLDRPRAEQVFHLLKNRRVTQFSFGYFAKAYQDVEDPDLGQTVRELTDIELFEVGPTLLGMNPATQLLEAASFFMRAGKDGSPIVKAEEALRQARELIDQVLLEIPAEEDQKSLPSAEIKAINVPEYVSNNAKRGLAYYEEGKGGDGLVDATIDAARQMASGSVTEEKVRKIGPWIARHIVDLDAPKNSNPDDPEYPGAGLVAMLLWGGGPDKEGARKTQAWAERETVTLDGKTIDDAANTESPEPSKDSGDAHGTINPIDERFIDLLIETR